MYMPRQIKHEQKPERQFVGMAESEVALKCLNLEQVPYGFKSFATEAKERLEAIIEAFLEADKEPDRRKARPLLLNVGRLLKGYSARRAFTGFGLMREQIFESVWPGKMCPQQRRVGELEARAVFAIASLADSGLLDRLRKCNACRTQWYFAHFSHQNFCSETCRVKFWEDSEQRKEQKRQRARETYRNQKRAEA